MSAYTELDATALRAATLSGERNVVMNVRDCLTAIDAHDEQLGAFLHTDREGARARAEQLDAALAAGEEPGPLFGVPIALKANMCVSGQPASCGSRLLADYRPPYTSTCAQRLLDAGAVLIGGTNMDEFAMGSSSENSAFGPSHNPWDTGRSPGGSSSGSAVAVAAGMVPLALGSDTGGSVRQPAAFCGIVGFKPTYGRVSRYGLVAFGSSLDQISPLARSTRDLCLIGRVISGADERDSTCLDLAGIDAPDAPLELAGLRIGVPAEALTSELDGGVRSAFEGALAALVEAGAERVTIDMPTTSHAVATYYVVATAEASSNLARYDGVRFGARAAGDGSLQSMIAATREAGFGDEVKRRILLGTYVLSAGYYDAWYGQAQKVRRKLAQEFDAAFETVDLILSPTTPTPAFRLGDKVDDPVAMYAADTLTVPASLAGLPALSLPCGMTSYQGSQLPVGLQLVGPALEDARVLRAALSYEELRGTAPRPTLSAQGAAR